MSHIIFGIENCFEILKHKLIETFISSPQRHFNVMKMSGIYSQQELHEHINVISARNAWATHVQLCMLGILAGVDVFVTDCTDARSLNWNLIANFVHQQLDPPGVCDPIFDVQRLCILHHNMNHHMGNEHFDPFYFT